VRASSSRRSTWRRTATSTRAPSSGSPTRPCGYGCILNLPEGALGFTTIELKTNFLRTAQPGATIDCEARLAHGGRTTQLWDATVSDPEGRTMALFRATQLMLR
jgi:acyl-coenzyme A thioesterase PaaI-like protein